MEIGELCTELGFSEIVKMRLQPRWEELTNVKNGKLPDFLSEAFFLKYYDFVHGPALGEVLPRVRSVIDICKKTPAAAFWLQIVAKGSFRVKPCITFDFTPPALPFGENDGIANLLAALSSAPDIWEKCQRRGIPLSYASDAMRWIGGEMASHAAGNGGLPGFRLRQMYWMRHYIDGNLYRIGRFEYLMHTAPEWTPVVLRNAKGELAALCRPGMRLDKNGLAASAQMDDNEATVSEFIENNGALTGIPVSPNGFARVCERATYDLKSWHPAYNPWNLVPSIHIPGGERMPLDSAIDSMRGAKSFFKTYFNRDVPLFVCNSWIFNPAWERYAPECNMARLQRTGFLSPAGAPGRRDGMGFLYGRSDVDPSELPAKNHAQDMMRRAFLDEGTLRTGCMFALCDDLDSLSEGFYRNKCHGCVKQ